MSDIKEEIKQDEVKKVQDQTHVDEEKSLSYSSSSEELNQPRKELGLVISALQSTVKSNSEKEKPIELADASQADELHSVGDRLSMDDNRSVSSESNNVIHYNDDEMISIDEIKSTVFEQTTIEQHIQDASDELESLKVKEPSEEVSSSQERVPSSEESQETQVVETKNEVHQETHEILPPTPGVAPKRQNNFERHVEDALDTDTYSENLIALNKINIKDIKENILTPREQEKADEPILRGVRHLFNNRFMKAKRLFEGQAESDPLHALGLGTMTFLKAIMTTDEVVTKNAIDVLTNAYSIANAQIDVATKKTVGDSIYESMNNYYNYIKFTRGTGLPASPKPATLKSIQKGVDFIPNGVLRAHVAKAECCLQIAILQLLQENVMGYIKCGMNLRRAYTSYSLVWQEYKRMGQVYHNFIDRDTISGIQFGIGAVHLVLSTLPQKILRIVSAFGWKADKHLGFALLKLCVEERRIRSPMASLVLLAYYTTLTTLCPQILSTDYTQPAIETLLDAQATFPNSAFFLYYAGRTSRLARNLTLSTQSFTYAIEISKNEWAQVEVQNVCRYEMGLNHMMEHNWTEAIEIFSSLDYGSPAISKYLTGACLEMTGDRTEAILAFAEVPGLIGSKTASTRSTEHYMGTKVAMFQAGGYQDMAMSLCAFEYIYLFSGFDFMRSELIQASIGKVDEALGVVLEAERSEYAIRTQELLPDTPPPTYFNQRATLLLLKAALYNALGAYREAIIHLNWIIDHADQIDRGLYVVPYAYWEAGVTSWGLENKVRSRSFWERALRFSKFDFEYRLATRVNLAITKAEELGVPKPEPKDPHERHKINKKEPVIPLEAIGSRQFAVEEQQARTRDLHLEYTAAIRFHHY